MNPKSKKSFSQTFARYDSTCVQDDNAWSSLLRPQNPLPAGINIFSDDPSSGTH